MSSSLKINTPYIKNQWGALWEHYTSGKTISYHIIVIKNSYETTYEMLQNLEKVRKLELLKNIGPIMWPTHWKRKY